MKINKLFTISTPVRIALIVFAVLLAAYFSLVAAMSTQRFHNWVEHRVVVSLEHLTGTRVVIDDLKVDPAIFQIDLRGVRFHGREGPSDRPLVAARIVVVRVNPLSLLFRRIWISWFYAAGVEIHWVTYPDGTTNLPGAVSKKSSAARELTTVSISALDLMNVNLYWNNYKIPLDLAARRVALLLYFSKLRGYWGSCSASPLQLRGRGRWSPALTFGTHLRFTQHGLALNGLVWRTAGASGEGMANVKWTPSLEAAATLRARGNLREFTRILGWNAVQAGQFQGEGLATYRDGRLAARGRLGTQGVSLRMPGFTPDRMDLASEFSADRNNILLSDLRIFTLGGSMFGQGEIRLEAPAPQFSFDLHLSGLGMDQALRTLPRGETLVKLLSLESKVDGTAQVSWAGNLKDVRSRFDLQLVPPQTLPAGLRPLGGSLRGSAYPSWPFVVNLDHAQLQTPRSSLLAQGALGAAQSTLRVNYSTTNFTESEPLVEYITALNRPIPLQLRSALVFSGTLTGPALSPEIRGRIQAGSFSYQRWAWSGFAASVDASPSHLQVSTGQLRSGPSMFDFDESMELADWNVKPNSEMTLTMEARRSPLRGLEEAVGVRYPVTGFATARLQLHGTVSNLTGIGNFQIVDGTMDGEPFDLVSAQPRVKDSSWDFQNILIRKGTGSANGWLRLDWPRRLFSMELHGANFSLAQFERLQRQPPDSGGAPKIAWIRGKANFQLRASGSLAEPAGQLRLNIRDIDLKGSHPGDLQARIGLQRRKLQAEGRLTGSSDERFDFTLDADAQESWPASLQGHFTNFRLNPWMRWLGAEYSEIPMTVSGSYSGKGPLRRPADFSMDAKAQALTVAVPGFVLKNDQPVELHYAGGTLEANSFRMRGPSTDVTMQMSASLLSQPTLSLAVHGNAQASVLRLFNPSIDAAGGFDLNVSVSGPLAQPALAGEIDVRNLSIRYGEMPLILAGLNGKIGLKGNQATIVSLNGVSGESAIQLSGSATISSPVIYDVTAHLQNLRLEYPVDFTSLLNGDLHLAGSSQQGELSGDIAIQQMFVGANFNVVNWIGQIGSTLSETPSAETPASGSRIRLDLRVTSNPEIRLSSRTLSFEATIDTTLGGTVAHPVAMGDIRIQQGQALIGGNQYQILRGDIAMASPFQTNPVLDIEAQTRVDTYNLTVDVTGPADRAKLAYRSDPPLPTEDILSLLALGYAPQQQLMTPTGSQPFGTLGASALLSQALSSQVSGRVQQLFGISRIRIDPNLLGPATAGGARVTVEEQLRHNLTITYSTNTAAAQQRDILVRWDLSNRISLVGEQDINGVYGFEIRFRRRLK